MPFLAVSVVCVCSFHFILTQTVASQRFPKLAVFLLRLQIVLNIFFNFKIYINWLLVFESTDVFCSRHMVLEMYYKMPHVFMYLP